MPVLESSARDDCCEFSDLSVRVKVALCFSPSHCSPCAGVAGSALSVSGGAPATGGRISQLSSLRGR